MDIILVHLGKSMPPYILTCLEQIRRFTNDRIIIVLSEMPMVHFSPSDDISMVSIDTMEKSDNWKKYKSLKHFHSKRYELELWNYACERLFAIEMVMKYLNINEALHIENDNLIYATPDKDYLKSYCGDSICITSVTETLLSAGIMYIGSYESIRLLNEKLNELMIMGEKELSKLYTNEMLHEMRLLKIIYDENPDLIKLLPIFPSKASKYVYDGASWGQHVGGVHGHKDEKSFHCCAHIIGRMIDKNKYDIKWIKENGHKLPHVIDKITKKTQPIYNLHIHSKNLERWVS
jgi:hypothetical protein